MNPLRPLTHLSQVPVFRFLSVEPRKRLAKKCPGIRKLHRELPFHLGQVKLEYLEDKATRYKKWREISLDGLTWKFQWNSYYFGWTVTLPSGHEIHKVANGFVNRFLKYYLDREGAIIGKLWLRNFWFNGMQLPHQMKVHRYQIDQDDRYCNGLWLAFLPGTHFQEMKICVERPVVFVGFLEQQEFTTDLLIIESMDEYKFDVGIENVSRLVHLVNPDVDWSDLVESCVDFQSGDYTCGSMYKGCLEEIPLLEDCLDTLRKDFDGEFKYSEDTVGVCAEMTGDRELFISYQLINHEIPHCFTAEILEKGTTKHYHQLPMDLQKKFRGFEDQRNRVRVITDANHDDKVKSILCLPW